MEQRTVAGRYELIEPLGSGWRARDTELEREVVVRLGADAEVGATALAHPHIARIFDQGEAGGERYAVLEYLPGGSLAERGALTEDDASHLAAALAYAHANGVVHGSIGPDAVLFDSEGRAKLADFGGEGEPEDDVRAFGALLEPFAQASPALAAAAAAALAGDLAGAATALEHSEPAPAPEPTTQIQRPAPAPGPKHPNALIAIVAAAAVAGGLAAAFLATSDDSKAEDPTTGSLSVPVPTGSTESTPEDTDDSPPTTTAETTTEQTTTATTEPEPEPAPAPATTAPPRTTIAPPPITEPPPPTTEPPPPPTTEPPPPTTEPPPATTAPA